MLHLCIIFCFTNSLNDGKVHGRTDGQMERENHEWTEGWMEQIINGWKNERIEKIMDDRKKNYGLMEKFMDGWMDRW